MLVGSPVAAQVTASGSAPAGSNIDLINPDRPGIADGSAVIGRGKIQLEAGVQRESRGRDTGDEHTSFVPTLLRMGLSDRWEVRFESNTLTRIDSSNATVVPDGTAGFAPVSLGVKFHIQDSAGLRQPSLGMIIRVFPASGSASFATTQLTGDLRLAADWDLTPRISLNPNVGLAVYQDERGGRFASGLFAMTLNYFNSAKTINPFLDVGVQTLETSGGGASSIVDGGLAYLPGRNWQIDVSAGKGVRGRTPPNLFVSLGISVRFRASAK